MNRKSTLTNKVNVRYLVPCVVMYLTQAAAFSVDTMILGNWVGADALAARSLCKPLEFLLDMFGIFFTVGAASMISIYKGERKRQEANEVYTLSVIAMIALGALLSAVVYFCGDQIATWLAGGGPFTPLTKKYLQYYALLPIPHLLGMGFNCIMSVDEHPVEASAIFIIYSMTLLASEIIYVRGYGFGIEGCVFAQFTGLLFACLIIVSYQLSKARTLRLTPHIGNAVRTLVKMAWTGSGVTFTGTLFALKTVVMNDLILQKAGEAGLIAFSLCNTVFSYSQIFSKSGAKSMVPLVGMFYGEKDYEGIRFTMRRTCLIATGLTFLLSLLLFVFAPAFTSIYGVTSEIAARAIRIFSPGMIASTFIYIMIYYYATMGRALETNLIALLDGAFLILPLAFIQTHLFGADGFWMSFNSCALIICALIVGIAYFRNKRSGGVERGVFSLPKNRPDAVTFEATVSSPEEIIEASARIIEFCKGAGCSAREANLSGVVIEEMGINTTTYAAKNAPRRFARGKAQMDILVSILSDEILIAFRNDLKQFNPTTYLPEERDIYEIDGIELVRKAASKFSYEYNLGLNCTNIVIARVVKNE